MFTEKTAVPSNPLREINGIGPSAEKKLSKGGVHTYTDLAKKTPAELATLVKDVPGLSEERIKKEDWIGQAKALQKKAEQLPENGQHYARFEIELLLESNNLVRRTKIQHRPNGKTAEIKGWNEEELVNFINEQAKLNVDSYSVSWPIDTKDEKSMKKTVRKFEVIDEEAGTPRQRLAQDKPFDIHLDLDLSKLESSPDANLFYSADVVAKNLNNGSRQIISSAQGKLPTSHLDLNLPGTNLRPGIYRLQVELGLNRSPQEEALKKILPGSLVQVF